MVPRWQEAVELKACITREHVLRYVNANTLVVQQTRRASNLALRVRRGGRSQLTDEQDDAVVGGV